MPNEMDDLIRRAAGLPPREAEPAEPPTVASHAEARRRTLAAADRYETLKASGAGPTVLEAAEAELADAARRSAAMGEALENAPAPDWSGGPREPPQRDLTPGEIMDPLIRRSAGAPE